MSDYPEHDKVKAIQDESQAIGAFLDNSGYTLCEVDADLNRFVPIYRSIERILADYFGIDLDELEREKRAMLDSLRANA